MTADGKPVTPIDIDKLKTSFENARLTRIEKERRNTAESIVKKKIDGDRLFDAIVETINERLLEAAASEKKSIIVWSMGEFGHCNSDDIIDEIPIDWEVFSRLEQYCKASGLVTETKKMNNKEGFRYYTYYQLHASWL